MQVDILHLFVHVVCIPSVEQEFKFRVSRIANVWIITTRSCWHSATKVTICCSLLVQSAWSGICSVQSQNSTGLIQQFHGNLCFYLSAANLASMSPVSCSTSGNRYFCPMLGGQKALLIRGSNCWQVTHGMDDSLGKGLIADMAGIVTPWEQFELAAAVRGIVPFVQGPAIFGV
jgi:hypothetical protein